MPSNSAEYQRAYRARLRASRQAEDSDALIQMAGRQAHNIVAAIDTTSKAARIHDLEAENELLRRSVEESQAEVKRLKQELAGRQGYGASPDSAGTVTRQRVSILPDERFNSKPFTPSPKSGRKG